MPATDIPESNLRMGSDARDRLRMAVEFVGGADTSNISADELVSLATGLLLGMRKVVRDGK